MRDFDDAIRSIHKPYDAILIGDAVHDSISHRLDYSQPFDESAVPSPHEESSYKIGDMFTQTSHSISYYMGRIPILRDSSKHVAPNMMAFYWRGRHVASRHIEVNAHWKTETF